MFDKQLIEKFQFHSRVVAGSTLYKFHSSSMFNSIKHFNGLLSSLLKEPLTIVLFNDPDENAIYFYYLFLACIKFQKIHAYIIPSALEIQNSDSPEKKYVFNAFKHIETALKNEYSCNELGFYIFKNKKNIKYIPLSDAKKLISEVQKYLDRQ